MPDLVPVDYDPFTGGDELIGARPSDRLTAGNIDLTNRPVVRNGDGYSTLRSMSFGTGQGEVLVPTVSDDGRLLDNRQAIDQFDRTGKQLGTFRTPDAATAYAGWLHDDQARRYGGPDQAQRMRELEQPGRDAIVPVSMIGEPAGARDAADFAGQFGTTVALGTGIGQAARYAAPYVGRAASAGYQTMRDVVADVSGGMPLDKLGRINQLTGDRLAGEMGGRSAGEPSRSFASIAEGDTPPASGVEPIRTWHGSPHDFPYVDNSKIGSGEGNQAYTRGAYSAEARAVGEGYRISTTEGPMIYEMDNLLATNKGRQITTDQAKELFRNTPMLSGLADNDQAVNALKGMLPRYDPGKAVTGADLEHYRNLDSQMMGLNRGKLYELDLHVKPEQLVDWDKSLDAQSPHVREGLDKLGWLKPPPPPAPPVWDTTASGRQVYRDAAGGVPHGWLEPSQAGGYHVYGAYQQGADKYVGYGPTLEQAQHMVQEKVPAPKPPQLPATAGELLRNMERTHGEQAVPQMLRDSGIPGVKYLDGGSRSTGEGTSNYVIYDDKLIDIVKKYGVAGLGLPAGAGALIPVDHQPQF